MPHAEDKIVDGQFRFHIDTENLRRNIHKIQPNDWISISDKWHGTSAIVANVLVKRDLNWFERMLKRFGVKVQESAYGYTWSSRRVVKGVDGEAKDNSVHFYDSDIWGVVCKEIQSLIPKGYTVYGEIVGYTPDGAAIQKGYHYGCQPGQHRFLVYRATVTSVDGKVLELGWHQVKAFCAKYGLEMVKEFRFGQAMDLLAEWSDILPGDDLSEWQGCLLAALEHRYIHDKMCPYNNMEVPAEGIVVRVERLDEAVAYKLKNYRFLEAESKALDSGEADMETVESEETLT